MSMFFTREKRPLNVVLMKLCVCELRAIAARYQVINDRLAAVTRNVFSEVNEADLNSPDGQAVLRLGHRLARFKLPEVSNLLAGCVEAADVGTVSMPDLAPARPADPVELPDPEPTSNQVVLPLEPAHD